ncbi:MAG: cobalamin-dependent protein [Deltaproteobacteria bacterium]|nr:cobalamin-dependent protein [Deltaproteobacteria bacterium]
MKTLLLHVPKFNNFYKPIGDFIWLNYMPMGLLAIGDFLDRNSLPVEIIHLGVEWVENRDFDVSELISDQPDIKAVGIPIHWHHQAYDAIEVAKRIKEIRSDIFIFSGGDTASFFHEEIINDFHMIDAVIRGHGEKPVCGLLQALKDNRPLDKVSNLTWRDKTITRANRMDYVGDAETISELNYSNFSLVRHADCYVKYVGQPFFFAKGFTKERNAKMFSLSAPLFPIAIGRGCPFNCTWCGGSQIPQRRLINGLKGFIYRSHESIIKTVQDSIQAGYGIMHSCMDPEPNTQEYFIELWNRIRRENIKTDWMFEANALPSDTFLIQFKKSFPGKDSIITLSPECGNEDLRLKHKGPGFSTKALFEKLGTMDRMNITTEIFFTYGLPGENIKLLEETIALQREIVKRFNCVRAIRTLSVEMEPGAPWHLEPERFGIVTNRRSFNDFYSSHGNPENNTFSSFGYYIPDYFEDPLDTQNPYQDFAKRMQAIKCRKFCFIHPNPEKSGKHPWQGRLFCQVASKLISLKPRNLSKPY